MIKELAYVVYSVRDVPRATAFYRDVLGLRSGELFNDEWVEFELGNATFALDGSGEAAGMVPGRSSGAAFDDINRMRANLLEAGVDVTEVQEFRTCWLCYVSDPEGNRFAIHQLKPR